MELKQIDTLLLKTLFLAVAGIVVFQTLGYSSLSSMLFLATFPLTGLLWLRSVRKSLTGPDLLMVLTAALALVNMLLNAGANNANMVFPYIKKLIMFVMSLLFLQTAYRLRIGQDMVRFLELVVDGLTLFLIAMYFLQGSRMYVQGGRVSKYLTFCFSNPNLTGLFLACLYMLKLHRLFSPERCFRKLLHIVMAGLMIVFILLTQSRNALLIALLFTALCGWLVFRGRKNMRIGKGTAAVIATFPAIFALGYMLLINTPVIQTAFSFLVDEGKTLTSRTRIWSFALENLRTSPLIGAYYEISGGSGTSQMHNTHMDIACSYGIPVLVMVCFLLGQYLHQHGRRYQDKEKFLYIWGFAGAVLLGIGEASLFSGGQGIYIFVGAFLLLANRAETGSEHPI